MSGQGVSMSEQHSSLSTQAYAGGVGSDNYGRDSSASEVFPTLPGYTFIKKIGQGAQGKVYLAEREMDHIQVAIKQLNIDSIKAWKEYELFHREADVLSRIRVKGTARFYDAIDRLEDDPPCSYIVQEYIVGRTLGDLMKTNHRFTQRQVYEVVIQIIDILHNLHTHNPPIIHRDIKPSNIILRRSGDSYTAHLIDFGAVANPKVQGGGSTLAGTFGYMPPEQLMGNPGPAADIYSLAACAIHMLSGRSPANMPVKDFRLIFEPDVQHLPPEVVNTLRKMLEPNVNDRLVDYDTIRSQFVSFTNRTFVNLSSGSSRLSEAQFNKRLMEVSSIGESGNFELWQNLDDVTPREIPGKYEELACNEKLHFAPYPFKIGDDNSFIGLELLRNPNVQKIIVMLIFWLFFACVFIYILLDIFIIQPISSVMWGIIMIGGVCAIVRRYLKMEKFQKNGFLYRNKKNDKTEGLSRDKIMQLLLLKEGRKTIGTVARIDYLPIERNKVYRNRNYDDKVYDHIAEREGARYAFAGLPAFKIYYRFNPPDDFNEKDLIHSFVMYDEPNFKIGDPVPILYLIRREETQEDALDGSAPMENIVRMGRDGRLVSFAKQKVWIEHVDSMPFPLPVETFNQMDDLYDVNVAKKIGDDNHNYDDTISLSDWSASGLSNLKDMLPDSYETGDVGEVDDVEMKDADDEESQFHGMNSYKTGDFDPYGFNDYIPQILIQSEDDKDSHEEETTQSNEMISYQM